MFNAMSLHHQNCALREMGVASDLVKRQLGLIFEDIAQEE
jgi:hypothetical protein